MVHDDGQGRTFTRFRHGAFDCTVVSDGLIEGSPLVFWSNVSDDAVVAALCSFGRPTDLLRLEMNVLVLERGGQRIVIDPGMGTSTMFGEKTGRFAANLARAGLHPEQIDLVLLTHAHPDHGFALKAGDGSAFFPNARVGLGAADFAFWTDESRITDDNPLAEWVSGMRDSLAPYADRLIMIEHGQEIVEGISAMATPGHTVGQMAYVIAGDGPALVVIGDVAHDADLESRYPDWRFSFDTDPELACRSRRQLYDFIAQGGHRVHGFHFPWPGGGTLKEADEGFDFTGIDSLAS